MCTHTPPFFAGRGGGEGGRGWTSYEIFKKEGGLTGSQLSERACCKRGGNLFQEGGGGGGSNFYKKTQLKSEIFKDKKVYRQKYFSPS